MITTINSAKLPKAATPNSVYYCADVGKVHDVILDFVIPEGRSGKDGVDGKSITGPQGDRGEQGLAGSILYCTDAEVKAAADELHARIVRFRAAALDALHNAQDLKHP